MIHLKYFETLNTSPLIDIFTNIIDAYVDTYDNSDEEEYNPNYELDWDSIMFTSKKIIKLISNIQKLNEDDELYIANIIKNNLIIDSGKYNINYTTDSCVSAAEEIYDYLENVIDDLDDKYNMFLQTDKYNL